MLSQPYSLACVKAIAKLGTFYAANASQVSADKTLCYFETTSAFYKKHAEAIASCIHTGDVPPPPPAKQQNKPTVAPTPYRRWPSLAQRIARRRISGEMGLGDTVERMLGAGGKMFKKAIAIAGLVCRCDGRKEWLTAKYPYSLLPASVRGATTLSPSPSPGHGSGASSPAPSATSG